MSSPTPTPVEACPRCGAIGPVRLYEGEICAACKSTAAWESHAETPLVITRADVDDAIARRSGIEARSRLMRAGRWAEGLLSFGLVVACAVAFALSWRPLEVGPLASLLSELTGRAWWTAISGGLSLVAGAVGLIRLRRRRRRLGLLVAHCGAFAVGIGAVVIGGLGVAATASYPFQYDDMPRVRPPVMSAAVERVVDATVTVVAPDQSGDASLPAIGSGLVISTQHGRAWLVTNSHVAMPYAAVGSFRDAHDAAAVWVQLADRRGARGTVEWVAPPPLDVALVSVAIDNPPEPVPIARESATVVAGTNVLFVPNPYRAGWLVHTGTVLMRRQHATPAGDYSVIYVDLPVQPGDSGSGLINDAGELVGINTWTRLGNAPRGISLEAETMRAIIDAIDDGTLDQLRDLPGTHGLKAEKP